MVECQRQKMTLEYLRVTLEYLSTESVSKVGAQGEDWAYSMRMCVRCLWDFGADVYKTRQVA